jgi:protein-L-isoaspartate(D-aspartate) O-methyltransferase
MGIRDQRVLEVIAELDRERFVPRELRGESEADRPLTIGYGQTISQPYIVGFMTEWLALTGMERVLEIGTGSGYQTAILARLAAEVFSLEIIPELARRAAEALRELGIVNVTLGMGDGWRGWPEAAPFDRIVVTAAPPTIPPALVEQLAPNGRMVVPVGAQDHDQVLKLIRRDATGELIVRDILPVRFVPMTGEAFRPRAFRNELSFLITSRGTWRPSSRRGSSASQ